MGKMGNDAVMIPKMDPIQMRVLIHDPSLGSSLKIAAVLALCIKYDNCHLNCP